MLTLYNPLMRFVNATNANVGCRLTVTFKDSDRCGNHDALAIRLLLEHMRGVSDDLIHIFSNTPIDSSVLGSVASAAYGVESITCFQPNDDTEEEYRRGHVEIITRDPPRLYSLLINTFELHVNTDELAKLSSVFHQLLARWHNQ